MTLTFLPLAGVVLAVVAIFLVFKILQGVFWILGRALKGSGKVVGHTARFARNMLVDAVHFIGAVLTGCALMPLALFNTIFGRFPAAKHYARAIEDELGSALLGLYRLAIGHPLRFLCLGGLLDGVERRIPDVVDRAPQPAPRPEQGVEFPGYRIFGTLQAGGSGAKLFLARPTSEKRAQLREAGHPAADEVVIKYFALSAGSTLPQIVRENQALKAAGRLGLVLEHELSAERFFYVMRYVGGEELDTVIHRLHASCGPEGLRDEELERVVTYSCDLLHTLDRFHGEGLWHKDVKPSNLIVADRHVHLVDLGLVTPLQADITLTTHGTEYYRDPEMVRLALQGVRVHEVDGAKFDIYSAGAVLYSMIEGSFPAHGSLSRISKRCPEGMRWIIRRAMTDMSARYGSAREMLHDLQALSKSRNPFAIVPADLPSFRRDQTIEEPHESEYAFAGTGAPRPVRGNDFAAYQASTASQSTFKEKRGYDGTRRSRRKRSLLLAVACLGFLGFMGAAIDQDREEALTEMRQIASSRHDIGSTLPAPDRQTVHAALDILRVPEISALTESWTSALSPEIQSYWSSPEVPEVSPDTPNTPMQPLGRILVLEDLIDSQEGELLQGVQEALGAMHFTVYGTSAIGDDPIEIELLSGARNAVGFSALDDPEAGIRLQDFLNTRSDLDAILWIGPNTSAEDLIYELFVRSNLVADERLALPGPLASH